MLPLQISFCRGEVCVRGTALRLPNKEMELLFTVAAAGPINGEHLMDMLWPEADGDAAHNAFRVCLCRLRKHVGNGAVIRRVGRSYQLEDGIEVDLYVLRDLIGKREDPVPAGTLDGLLAAIRAGSAARAALGSWFEPFERLLWTYAIRCGQCRASDLVTEQ